MLATAPELAIDKFVPAFNAKFWESKRLGNVQRDRNRLRELRRIGWRVLTVWACEISSPQRLVTKLKRFLSPET